MVLIKDSNSAFREDNTINVYLHDLVENKVCQTCFVQKYLRFHRRKYPEHNLHLEVSKPGKEDFFRKYCICMQLTMIRVQPPGSALCHLLLLPKTAARISSRFSVTDSFLNLPFFDPMVSPSPGCHVRERQGISSVFHHPEPSRQMLPMKQACGIFERCPWTENVQNQLEARTTQHYLSKVAGVCSLQ